MGNQIRTGIDARSDRAKQNKLTVERVDCPKCGHHKALTTQNLSKCSKCGYEHFRAKVWVGGKV
jgi:ribosomal protein S27AE